jgi:hypothetical protein
MPLSLDAVGPSAFHRVTPKPKTDTPERTIPQETMIASRNVAFSTDRADQSLKDRASQILSRSLEEELSSLLPATESELFSFLISNIRAMHPVKKDETTRVILTLLQKLSTPEHRAEILRTLVSRVPPLNWTDVLAPASLMTWEFEEVHTLLEMMQTAYFMPRHLRVELSSLLHQISEEQKVGLKQNLTMLIMTLMLFPPSERLKALPLLQEAAVIHGRPSPPAFMLTYAITRLQNPSLIPLMHHYLSTLMMPPIGEVHQSWCIFVAESALHSIPALRISLQNPILSLIQSWVLFSQSLNQVS